jgi:hypothetical protein
MRFARIPAEDRAIASDGDVSGRGVAPGGSKRHGRGAALESLAVQRTVRGREVGSVGAGTERSRLA